MCADVIYLYLDINHSDTVCGEIIRMVRMRLDEATNLIIWPTQDFMTIPPTRQNH